MNIKGKLCITIGISSIMAIIMYILYASSDLNGVSKYNILFYILICMIFVVSSLSIFGLLNKIPTTIKHEGLIFSIFGISALGYIAFCTLTLLRYEKRIRFNGAI